MGATGLVFGLGTHLARMTKGGRLVVEAERLLTLLSVAKRRPVSADVLRHVEAAAGHWHRGDKALANLRLVFAGLPRLHASADARRLHLAEALLDAGLPPRTLMTELDLDPSVLDLAKAGYNPNQARVPAGHGPESGRWEAIWIGIKDWLDDPVPEYDQDTGIQVGAQSRGRAIATNPITVGVAGTAALLGGETAAGAAVVQEPVTIAEAVKTLQPGMTRAMFGRLAGFVQGPAASSQASTKPTVEVIDDLRSAGVARKCIAAFQRFYAGVAERQPENSAAVHLARLLSNILKAFK